MLVKMKQAQGKKIKKEDEKKYRKEWGILMFDRVGTVTDIPIKKAGKIAKTLK